MSSLSRTLRLLSQLRPLLTTPVSSSYCMSLSMVNSLEKLKTFPKKQHFLVRSYANKPQLTLKFIEERVILVLKLYDKINPDLLTLESHFMKDLGLDSLDHVEVIMAMEDEFGFEIPDHDAERLLTPAALVRYVADKEDVYD